MKNIIISCLFLITIISAKGQTATPATQLANRIAQKMKDTLTLTVPQKNQIYTVNIGLHNLKMTIRQQYTNPDSLRIKMQRIERGRDSLYHLILSEPKYQLYLQKKRNLVSAN